MIFVQHGINCISHIFRSYALLEKQIRNYNYLLQYMDKYVIYLSNLQTNFTFRIAEFTIHLKFGLRMTFVSKPYKYTLAVQDPRRNISFSVYLTIEPSS